MRYFSTPGAGLAHREDPDWAPPVDWRDISEAAYNERKAVIDARNELHLAALADEARAARDAEIEAMIDARIALILGEKA